MRLRRSVTVLAAVVLILLVAVTPLNAVVAPSHFELRYPDGLGTATAVLDDDTHLVQALRLPDRRFTSEAVGSNGRYLAVSWGGGCLSPAIWMRFAQVGARYRLTEHTSGEMCQLLMLLGRSFVLDLYTPIDPGLVDIVHV